jgi:penicillin-binding protein 1C
MRHKIFSKRGILVSAAIFVFVVVAVYHLLPDYTHAIEEQRAKAGTEVVDRDGRILRLLPDSRGRFSIWYKIDNIPLNLKEAVIAAEDKRFLYHPGFDPIAIARAAYLNLLRGKIISGASTITEQVVRLIHPRPRTYLSKLIELLAATKMECRLSKDQILELDMNLSPMSGNIRGVGLAARRFFGKKLENIDVAEAAVLAAVPRSPSRYDPRRSKGRKQLIAEKDRILRRMEALGYISPRKLKLMSGPVVRFHPARLPMEAPHFVDLALTKGVPKTGILKTTIALDVQHAVERILRSNTKRLRDMGVEQVGAIVTSVKDSEVLALVGSLGYNKSYLGYNDAVLARRSAGSVLKPFLYALALEQGQNASSEIPDTLRTYRTPQGDYQPFNADRRWYGPVDVRLALGNSLNVPAVKTLKDVGLEPFYNLLKRLGIVAPDSEPAEYYGLGLAIGNVEVSLFRLAQAFGCLAREGVYRPLKIIRSENKPESRLLSPESAYVINDILADPSARLLTFGNPSYFDFGFPVSIKTGTSTNYRDSWMMAYTPDNVVGLWAGNFNGSPTSHSAAASALGPIMKQIIGYLYGAGPPERFKRPPGVRKANVCWLSGKIATPRCPYVVKELVIAGTAEMEVCDLPHNKDIHYYLGPPYAQWLSHKEAEEGITRFRLAPLGRAGWNRVSGDRLLSKRRNSIEIVTPHDQDIFVITPESSRKVLFRAIPNPVVSRVMWMVDGMEVASTPPPYEFFWGMTRGRHVVYAITPNRDAAEITIQVE